MNILKHCVEYHDKYGKFYEPSLKISQRICNKVNSLLMQEPVSILAINKNENINFNGDDIGDIIAIIFESFIDTNCNPTLWESVELENEIRHMLRVLFYGPCGEISEDRSQGVPNNILFIEAKMILCKNLDRSHNLFSL